ncbi:hypothetical protein TESS_TESS_00851 [Tessaracoccus sp. O5.2]|uniref:hypothetical protein n=1 Tax=Tessaracoccus sp. O5.2 TaxID=3157622 RepID=UPI0035E7BA30
MSTLTVRNAPPWPGPAITAAASEVLTAYALYALAAPHGQPLAFPSSRHLRRAYVPTLSRREWGRALRELIDLGLVDPTPQRVTVTLPTNLVHSPERAS